MKLLINYSNYLFRGAQKLNSKTGIEVALFDEVISYSFEDIDEVFYQSNKNILRQNRGGGYWLWKPYFIKKSLELINEGDFLFYCDSGSYFLKAITPLIATSLSSEQDIIVFGLREEYIEKHWTKRDAFVLMECDRAKYSDTKQRLGGFILLKKSQFTIDFIDEYLRYAQDERIITDTENQLGYPNYENFVRHRHDQSILSLLSKQKGLDAFRDPSQFGNAAAEFYTNSKYGQIIELTRTRDKTFRTRLLYRAKQKREAIENYLKRHCRRDKLSSIS